MTVYEMAYGRDTHTRARPWEMHAYEMHAYGRGAPMRCTPMGDTKTAWLDTKRQPVCQGRIVKTCTEFKGPVFVTRRTS